MQIVGSFHCLGQLLAGAPARSGPQLKQGCGPQVGQANCAIWVVPFRVYSHLNPSVKTVQLLLKMNE